MDTIATIAWYPLLYLAAIFAALGVMHTEARGRFDRDRWSVILVTWAVGGIVGAMLPRVLLGDLVAARTAVGAVAGATIALFLVARALRIDPAAALDTTAVAIPIGGAIARLGCFLGECCRGLPTTLPVGIAGHDDVRRHPTQLYEATLDLAIAVAVSRIPAARLAAGSRFLISLGAMSAVRFAVEFVRESDRLGPLSLAQWIVGPIAILCFVAAPRAESMYRALAAPRTVVRPIVAGAVLVVLVLGAAGRLAPLEVSAIVLCVAVGVAVSRRFGTALPPASAALALQIPAITSDSTYPRIYYSIGAGVAAGSFDHRTVIRNCENEMVQEWVRHHSFSGGALEAGVRRQNSRTQAFGLRLRGFSEVHRVGEAIEVQGGPPPSPAAYSRNIVGVSVAGDFDWKYLGLTAGVTFGDLYLRSASGFANNELGRERALPVLGVRLGQANAGLEVRFADELPTFLPSPVFSLGVVTGDSIGNRIRIAGSEAGLLVSMRLITRNGLEFDPIAIVGGSCSGCARGRNAQAGLMVRQWFRGPPPRK